MVRIRGYDGDEVRVTFEASRCIHAARCVSQLPAVFDTARRPWIDPAGASAEDIAAVVHHCPTGALKYERTDGGPAEQPESVNTLTVAAAGPVFARGDIQVIDAERRLIARETRAALCRCGASANKPWCDGSHVDTGFDAPAELGEGRLKPRPDESTGPLVVRLRPDGPLLLDGAFRLRSQDSEDGIEGGGAALCRCGASANKPFCDGTHNSIGFSAVDPVGS